MNILELIGREKELFTEDIQRKETALSGVTNFAGTKN
jgi:hypothetical protein